MWPVDTSDTVNESQAVMIAGRTDKEDRMNDLLRRMWRDDSGQDIAEYAVMLAVILVIVIGTVKLIGTKSNTVFSQVASSLGT